TGACLDRYAAAFSGLCLRVDCSEHLLRGSGRGGAESLVEMDGFGHFLAHQLEPAGELGILRQRLLHPFGVAAAQGSRGVPRQQRFDVLALRRLVSRHHHGQPLSTPAAFSSSDNFFRAYNMRVFTVASGIPTISATSSTVFSW